MMNLLVLPSVLLPIFLLVITILQPSFFAIFLLTFACVLLVPVGIINLRLSWATLIARGKVRLFDDRVDAGFTLRGIRQVALADLRGIGLVLGSSGRGYRWFLCVAESGKRAYGVGGTALGGGVIRQFAYTGKLVFEWGSGRDPLVASALGRFATVVREHASQLQGPGGPLDVDNPFVQVLENRMRVEDFGPWRICGMWTPEWGGRVFLPRHALLKVGNMDRYSDAQMDNQKCSLWGVTRTAPKA